MQELKKHFMENKLLQLNTLRKCIFHPKDSMLLLQNPVSTTAKSALSLPTEISSSWLIVLHKSCRSTWPTQKMDIGVLSCDFPQLLFHQSVCSPISLCFTFMVTYFSSLKQEAELFCLAFSQPTSGRKDAHHPYTLQLTTAMTASTEQTLCGLWKEQSQEAVGIYSSCFAVRDKEPFFFAIFLAQP